MKVLAGIAFVLGVIMVALDFNPSWSEYARTLHESLLFGFMISVVMIFTIRSKSGLNKDIKAIKGITVSQLDFLTALFFGFIVIFPVTHPEKSFFVLHYVFTALAIITAYVTMLLQQTEKMMKISSWVAIIFGLVAFLAGLLTPIYNTGTAELIVALPILIHVLNSRIR